MAKRSLCQAEKIFREKKVMGGSEPKNIKVGTEFHRRVKAYAAEQGESIQELAERVLRREMDGDAPAPKSELDGLTKDDRALVLDLIAWLRDEPAGDRKRRNVIRGILTVFRG
jgi:hypothetical protein